MTLFPFVERKVVEAAELLRGHGPARQRGQALPG